MNWLATFEEFCTKTKTIRHAEYYEDYFNMHRKHLRGYVYYLYLDADLNVINPYTKKDENKKVLKNFVSTCSREDVLEKAYLFILKYANDNGLYDESVCDPIIAERQRKQLF